KTPGYLDQIGRREEEGDAGGRGERVHPDAFAADLACDIDPRRQGSDRRTDDESDPERDADERHALRAIALVGRVGDRGARDREIAAHRSTEETRRHEDPEVPREEPR